ncbi:MAG: enoyl-CoA hydratase/isomerase family protein, partial [Pseudomonadota bacterium]
RREGRAAAEEGVMSGPDTGRVEVEIDGAVAVLRFVNPPEGYMDDGTEAALEAALDQVEGDDAVRAVVLTGGRPDVFIRHFDVRVLEARGRALAERGVTFSIDRPVPDRGTPALLSRIEASEKPFVAAINGVCMGGGFETALACDLRFAAEGDYPIGLPEANIGVLPGAGGTQRLPRLIGEAKALELMLLGRTVGPEEAARLGMVSACVPDALEAAMTAARRLAAQPPRALAHIKRLVRGTGGFAAERTLFCDLMVSDEGIARMARMNAEGLDIRDV